MIFVSELRDQCIFASQLPVAYLPFAISGVCSMWLLAKSPRRSAWLVLGQLRAWAVNNGPVHFLPFSMFLLTFTVFYFYFSKYSMTIKDSTYVWKSKVSKCISATACNMDILFIFVSNIDTRCVYQNQLLLSFSIQFQICIQKKYGYLIPSIYVQKTVLGETI